MKIQDKIDRVEAALGRAIQHKSYTLGRCPNCNKHMEHKMGKRVYVCIPCEKGYKKLTVFVEKL